jgi:L-aspartate oxidase
MQKRVGIVRTVARLQEARCTLETLAAQIETAYRQTPPTVESCEARNLAACALLITASALARNESRGLHYVLDYPQPREELAACPTLLMPL